MQMQKQVLVSIIIVAIAVVAIGGVFYIMQDANIKMQNDSAKIQNETANCIPEGGAYAAPSNENDLCCPGLVAQPTTQSGTVGICVKAGNEIADWKMYTDEEYGISFQYPFNWILEKQFSPLSPQSDKRDGFDLHSETDKLNSINIDHTEMDCNTLIEKGFKCSMVGGHIIRTNSKDAKVLEIFNKVLPTFKFTK